MNHILIVDDDKDLRDNISDVLTGAGFSVSVAANGAKALERLDQKHFNLVLLDLVMPGMTGMELMTVIRKRWPQTRLIMMTAFSTVDNAVTAIKNGADDYITKPFKIDDLLCNVRRSLEEANFDYCKGVLLTDEAFSCLANPLRRQILLLIHREGELRFMDITRALGVEDHTKVNFHLRVLKEAALVEQDVRKSYLLTADGKRVIACMRVMAGGQSDG